MKDEARIPRRFRDRQAAEGQALVEYTLIFVLIIVAVLATLAIFQDAVINGLWGATDAIVEALARA